MYSAFATGDCGGKKLNVIFFKNRLYKLRFLHTNFWTENSGPKLEIYAHLGTNIAITFSKNWLISCFLSQIVQKRETRLFRPFVLVHGDHFGGGYGKKRDWKNTCRNTTKVMPCVREYPKNNSKTLIAPTPPN